MVSNLDYEEESEVTPCGLLWVSTGVNKSRISVHIRRIYGAMQCVRNLPRRNGSEQLVKETIQTTYICSHNVKRILLSGNYVVLRMSTFDDLNNFFNISPLTLNPSNSACY